MKLIQTIISIAASAMILAYSSAMTFAFAGESNLKREKIINGETQKFYKEWKEKYLIQDKYVTNEKQYYVFYGENEYIENSNMSVPVTVSEAHGYGMLILTHMANYDTQAKEYFDGMFRYFKAHQSEIGANLMSWQQCDNGSALIDGAEEGSMTGGSCDSATDGDMDIAYSLLLADTVWGSNGEIDYYNEAIAVINDIMKYDVNHEYWTLTLGDWVSECEPDEKYYSATRASDFIVQYLPVFAEVTGDENWLKVYNTTYSIINDMVAEYKTGLLPDFIIRDSQGKFIPAPADFLEGEYDGCYSYNSCRTPWRIGMDYLVNNNQDALKFAEAINSFMIQASDNDPWEIMAGYKLNGTAIEDYNDLCFTAPCLISAACSDNSDWHDKLRDAIVNYGDDVYYGDTIKMLCLIADDGGWIVPKKASKTLIGDINYDGEVNVSDLILMQKYLLKISDFTAEQYSIADIHNDTRINCMDWVSLKRIIIQN